MFAQHGFQATGIRDIAPEAGLTTATLYHYIESKDELLREIMVETLVPLKDAAISVLQEHEAPDEQLGNLVMLHIWAQGSRQLANLVTDTEIRSLNAKARREILSLRNDYELLWRTTVERGLKEDVFSVEEPRVCVKAILEMFSGFSHWYSSRGRLSLNELCCLHVDWALGMVRATRKGRAVRASDLNLIDPGIRSVTDAN